SKITKGFKIMAVILGSMALVSYVTGFTGFGNFSVFVFLVYSLYHFVLVRVISNFQTKSWPKVQESYGKMIAWVLEGKRPMGVVFSMIGLFIFSIIFTGIRQPPVVFFPQSDPNFIFTYVRMPIGTDQRITDSVTHIVEKRIS